MCLANEFCARSGERLYGALAAVDKTVALAPYDTFMLSRLIMVLVQVGRPDQALRWADEAAARDPDVVGSQLR